MDGSEHRKLAVIGKAKTPWCLAKKYKMQVKDMAVDWYASKNAWMTIGWRFTPQNHDQV